MQQLGSLGLGEGGRRQSQSLPCTETHLLLDAHGTKNQAQKPSNCGKTAYHRMS